MSSKLPILMCIGVVLLVAATVCRAEDSNEAAVNEAVSAAESWLGVVDSGEYGKSWDQSSELFRNAVSRAEWEQSLNAARRPFGALVSRKLKSTRFATSLPGAPDGEYVVIQFEASFGNKRASVETVTPMLEKDGQWRVSGYFIK
ncbi:MAG: DUF4019 domain-containing protein [Thermoanaerobaculia bacterium]